MYKRQVLISVGISEFNISRLKTKNMEIIENINDCKIKDNLFFEILIMKKKIPKIAKP